MIINFFWAELNNINLKDMWFQQYNTTHHFSNIIIQLLTAEFIGPVISGNGDVNGY